MKKVKTLTQRIKELFLIITSCILAIFLMLISNQFQVYLFSHALFTSYAITKSAILGLFVGVCYHYCALYDYRDEFEFWQTMKHLIFMHAISFTAMNVLKIFALFHFFPSAFLGLSMLGGLFITYNYLAKYQDFFDYNQSMSLLNQFLMCLFIGVLAFLYANACVYYFTIPLGFDLTVPNFTFGSSLIWLVLNFYGLEMLDLQQQLTVSICVFIIAALTLCVCQFQLSVPLLYVLPAIGYYCLSGWLSSPKLNNEKIEKDSIKQIKDDFKKVEDDLENFKEPLISNAFITPPNTPANTPVRKKIEIFGDKSQKGSNSWNNT